MSADIVGVDGVIKALKAQFTSQKWNKIENKALVEGAKVVARNIATELEPFADTHASIDEIVVSKPSKKGGYKHILVGWEGPKQRYRIIHLNEFGYTKNGRYHSPRSKGAIKRAVDKAKQPFVAVVSEELRKHL